MRLEIELTQIKALVLDVNPRKEGKEKEVLACDIKCEVGLTNDALAVFSPTLKSFLFDTSGMTDLAGDLMVRYPSLKLPLHWDAELVGAHVKIVGEGGKPITFPEALLHKFTIAPQNGGTVIIGFTVSVYPDASQLGRASELIGMTTIISVEPPELPEMQKAA